MSTFHDHPFPLPAPGLMTPEQFVFWVRGLVDACGDSTTPDVQVWKRIASQVKAVSATPTTGCGCAGSKKRKGG